MSSASQDGLINEVNLTLPAVVASVPVVRQVVDEAAMRCGYSPEQRAEIEMAVDEAVSNIIEHGYAIPPACPEVRLTIEEYSDRLEITLVDCSTVNFGAATAPQITPDEYFKEERHRGLGLYIIHHFMDRVEHRFVYGRGNELRLTKHRN